MQADHAVELPPRASPEAVGLSSVRLARIAETLDADVAQDRLPGAVLAIARRGRLAHFEAYGFCDRAAGLRMGTDAIFNIASMTKPMTVVAALQLCERGLLSIDDPVAKFFPKFADMRVAVLDASGEKIVDTLPAARPITIQDLMRHTCGLAYGGRGTSAIHKLYPEGSGVAARAMSAAEFLDRLSSLPLFDQPGEVWRYGFGLDVLGLVVEKIASRPLDAYMQAHIFAPLGMADTGFVVPAAAVGRYAKALPKDPLSGEPQSVTPLTEPAKFACGGGGAVSTAGDYLRFALMLLNKGRYGDARILGRKTVEYMLANQLGPNVRSLIAQSDPTRADYGFGLGVAVRVTAGIARLFGSVGDFNWPGMSGTNWWGDPQEELAVVFLSHAPGPIRWHYRQVINALVYQAIDD